MMVQQYFKNALFAKKKKNRYHIMGIKYRLTYIALIKLYFNNVLVDIILMRFNNALIILGYDIILYINSVILLL